MQEEHESRNDPEREAARSRREFLKKAGRFAVYTPPAVMLLMEPGKASMLRSGLGTQSPPRQPPHPKQPPYVESRKPPAPVFENVGPPGNNQKSPQVTGTLKDYINRTGQFEINSYRTQQSVKPSGQQQPWIEMRKTWWSSFWSKAFGGS